MITAAIGLLDLLQDVSSSVQPGDDLRLDDNTLVLLQAPLLFSLVGIGVLLERVLDVWEWGYRPVESRYVDLHRQPNRLRLYPYLVDGLASCRTQATKKSAVEARSEAENGQFRTSRSLVEHARVYTSD